MNLDARGRRATQAAFGSVTWVDPVAIATAASFARFDPALGDWSIWAANPDGTHQRRLTHVPSFFSDWSPDGRRIAFDFVDDTGVHIATMDPNGRHVRQLTFGPAIQEIPDWSPDGRQIAFNAAPVFPGEPGFHTDIWIMRADGSHKRQLTSGFDEEPVFSPTAAASPSGGAPRMQTSPKSPSTS